MTSIKGIFTGLGLFALLGILHAQLAVQSVQEIQPVEEVSSVAFSDITLQPLVQLRGEPRFLPISMSAVDMAQLKRLSDRQLETFLNALAVTPQLPFKTLAKHRRMSTFYSLQHPEWPPLPCNASDLPVWQMKDFYLLNDIDYDYNAAATLFASSQSVSTSSMSLMSSPPGFGDVGSSTNIYYGSVSVTPDYGTNLYLSATNVSANIVSGQIHNTSLLFPYTLFSRQNLDQAVWSPETTFYGAITTNLTPFTLAMLERDTLFVRAWSMFAPRVIGAGAMHNVVIRRDGTVWSWGANSRGQLGNGTWAGTNAPVPVTGLSNIVAVAVPPTGNFNLALDSAGRLWSWGRGYDGQLGLGDDAYSNINVPAQLPGINNVVALAAGQAHALALKSDGTVWAWGNNNFYQLGNGNTASCDFPAPVPGLTNVASVAAGAGHSFALRADGRVWGWGGNYDGELGLGNTTDQSFPVLIPSLTNVVALSAGYYHSLALLANGRVKAWGDDGWGATGVGNSLTPVTVSGLSNIIAIACGGYHNLALDTNGSLFLWGNGDGDQLGNGTETNVAVPFRLSSISNVTAIAGGENSSLVSTASGLVYAWGAGYNGQQALPSPVNVYTNFSSDGSGMPDVWELQYFGHLGVNPAADADGDGRSNLLEYQGGNNPTNFDTPPALNGLAVNQGSGSTAITVTWDASELSVWYYAVYRTDYNYDTWQYASPQAIGTVLATSQNPGGTTMSFVDNGEVPGGDGNSIYTVQAVFPGGVSPVSPQASINNLTPATRTTSLPLAVNLLRNNTGRWQLMFADMPADVQTIRLNWSDADGITVEQNLSPANLINGIYSIPDADVVYVLDNTLSVQTTATNGIKSAVVQAGMIPNDAPYFVDGRRHLKQNLSFLIRAASRNQPFFSSQNPWMRFGFAGWGNYFDIHADKFNKASTDFETCSFLYHVNNQYDFLSYVYQLDNLWPFTANYDLANYFIDLTRTNLTPFGSTNFVFYADFSSNIPAPAILDHADPYWILQPSFSPYDGYSFDNATTTNWAVTVTSTQTVATLASGSHNLFGLPYLTGCEVDMKHGQNNYFTVDCLYQILPPGSSVTANPDYLIGGFASWCPAPVLQPVDYYFAPLINPWADTMNLPGDFDCFQWQHPGQNIVQPFPTPLIDSFAVTNQTPAVMFGSVSQPMILGGWAKYAIQGSSPAKYAYLGQYFVTNVFKVDANGTVTTTSTGLISPYGEFFPTEPGTVAMTTLPDIDTGLQATARVQVISLALDANHDGAIDPTYNGPDFVSANRPFRFWVNNNYDRWTPDSDDGTNYMDDVASTAPAAASPYTGVATPDFDFKNIGGNRVIPCSRDLEDFARLWICGLTTNVLAALPTNCTVTLSWGDAGNPNANNPTLDLFTAIEANGGTGYLTNSTIAAAQADSANAIYIGRLGPGQSLQLNSSRLLQSSQPYNWQGSHYLWCGVTNGTGKLNLTIADAHSNVLAQTSTFIQLNDIKQMYERWTVGETPAVAPTTYVQLATNDLPAGVSKSFRYAQPGDATTPYILFVHGWNMNTYDKDRFAETAFKRLYWQGYQGRFGSFRWPTDFDFTGSAWDLAARHRHFDNSEFNAWKSGQSLKDKLIKLNQQYPGNVHLMSHSMGNVVAGEALKLAGNSQLVNTYVAMQGAVAAHSYDSTTPERSLGIQDSDTPDCYAHFWTNGAPSYFNGSAGAGTYVNFFNTNDFALNKWQLDQNFKPDVGWGCELVSQFDPFQNRFYREIGGPLYFPADTYEIFSYCDEARSYALGAQPDVEGSFNNQQVDLQTIWPPDTSPQLHGPYSAHFWHSAQFRGDSAMQINFWRTLLGQNGFKLK